LICSFHSLVTVNTFYFACLFHENLSFHIFDFNISIISFLSKTASGNFIRSPTTLKKEEILENHMPVLCSLLEFEWRMKNWTILLISWISKLHKCPYKQRYIAWSARCSTTTLLKLLTSVLSVVKTRLQIYCDTSYWRGGVNQMWFWKILLIC
jgi:hypothetical protein